ncbi:hypothetical protein [Haladaptatus sp. DYF46]|uniref:hypothetical protein n=1 Tax=Haladaptatus sp. DYF46 TaxID=2886041 RepID=UPI001E5FB539|nr:hypothetical protein [Haladaptatus sp. DYF46]
MQRRAVAVYSTFFLLVATGAFVALSTTPQPVATMEQPDRTVSTGDAFSFGDRRYNVTDVSATIKDGKLVRSASARWTNESATYTETWENNSTVSRRNITYRVLIPNESNVAQATLREVRNLSNGTKTVTRDNVTYVVTNGSSGNKTLVPEDEYKREQFGTPRTVRLSGGETLEYANNSTTVANISESGVEIEWTAPRTTSVQLGTTSALTTTLIRGGTPREMHFPAGTTVTLDGEEYAVHYPNNSSVELSSDVEAYQSQIDTVKHQNKRLAGFWGVFILSLLAATLLAMLGYLPSKG